MVRMRSSKFLAIASRSDGFSADLAAAKPGKMFPGIERVGIVRIADEELVGVFIAGVITFALNALGALALGAIVPAAVLELPDGNVLDIVALRNDAASRFEDERVQTFFGEFFRGPATGDA